MGCFGRATCTVHLISAPDQPGRKQVYFSVPLHKRSWEYTVLIKSVPLNFLLNTICTVLLLCLLRNLMEQTLYSEEWIRGCFTNWYTLNYVCLISKSTDKILSKWRYVGGCIVGYFWQLWHKISNFFHCTFFHTKLSRYP